MSASRGTTKDIDLINLSAMKCILLNLAVFTIFIFHQLPLPAQPQEKIDSLNQLLRTTQLDTAKIQHYAQLCWLYATSRTKLDSARSYADSISFLAHQLQDEKSLMLSHFYYGVINRFEGNAIQGLKHLKKYLNYHEQSENDHYVATGLFQISVINKNLGNYDKSLSALHRILEIHRKNGYQYGVGFTLYTIGSIQLTMEKYPQAIISCRNAIAILEQENEPMDLALAFMHLGDVFREIDAFDSANHYYLKALQLSFSLNDNNMVSSVLEDIGNLSASMDLYERALKYHKQSLEIIEQSPEPEIRHLAISLIKVGQDYLNLDDYSSATKFLERGLNLSQEIRMKPEVAAAYQGLMDVNAASGDFESAFDYHQLYSAMKDSIFDEEKIKQINELDAKYQIAQKDQEINLLTKENEVKEAKVQGQSTLRNALIGGLILFAIIAALIFYSMRQKLKNQKIIASTNEEVKSATFKQQLGELENKALRSQMNPHFIFNCMNSINRMILSQDTDDASSYLTKFAKLIRLMLQNSEKPTVPLEKELALIESYIQLESLTNKGKISYEISVDAEIDQEAICIPSMVLQPFIENAIWHGLMNKEDEGHIKILIKEDDDLLKCMVEDNGIGRDKALELKKQAVLKSKSMGLSITQKRLQLLSKEELRDMVRFTDLKDPSDQPIGTRVNVLIPIS